MRIKYCLQSKKSGCKGIGGLQRATNVKRKLWDDRGDWGRAWVWGSALVSEGGRRPQNSLTGSDPMEKLSMHGISGICKVISAITIVV